MWVLFYILAVLHTSCVRKTLQNRLAAEVERDAMRKSEAAQEAFLAELAKDQKNLVPKEAEYQKQARDKSKEKRKAKDQKKSKDAKVSWNFSWPMREMGLEMVFFSCRVLLLRCNVLRFVST